MIRTGFGGVEFAVRYSFLPSIADIDPVDAPRTSPRPGHRHLFSMTGDRASGLPEGKRGASRRMDHADDVLDDVENTAISLIRQYGEDAEVIATMHAAEAAALGHVEALAAWDKVIAVIAGCQRGADPEPSPRLH